MNNYQLLVGLCIATVGPLLTLRYLRGILRQVIDLLCPAPGSSEFWWKIITVLALTGSMLLMLIFGLHDDSPGSVDFLRRSLLLTTLSVFLSVAFVANRIWSEIAKWLHRNSFEKPAAQPLNSQVEP